MTTIHVVANVEKINAGVWKAAMIANGQFAQKNVKSILVVCDARGKEDFQNPESTEVFFLNRNSPVSFFKQFVNRHSIDRTNVVVITHGSWLRPTKIGYLLHKMGFPWIYVPQGMLEPWSMEQNKLLKGFYFRFVEYRLVKNASVIRAVSGPEKANLERLLSRKITLIPNGVSISSLNPKNAKHNVFLFMARLHEKKGVLPLVKAWHTAMKNQSAKLIIAGPDEGELEKIQPYIGGNIQYVGAVYGEQKAELLNSAHYYMLPSHSEGFPTSVLEAMSYGAIPLISKGCNFPEVFENNLGYNIEPDESQIAEQLRAIVDKPFDETLSMKNRKFIEQHYSESVIGEKLHALYSSLLKAQQ
jgi:glycosyltransferase involved in cell wall biosynthesis